MCIHTRHVAERDRHDVLVEATAMSRTKGEGQVPSRVTGSIGGLAVRSWLAFWRETRLGSS